MANAFTSPPTYPSPDAMGVGQIIRAAQLEAVADALNWAHGEGCAVPLVEQWWAADQCRYEYTASYGVETQATLWRAPIISPAHLSLEAYVYAESAPAGGGGIVRLASAGAGGSVFVGIPAGGPAWYSLPALTVAILAADYDDLSMSISAAAGNETTVHGIAVGAVALTSPLGAGAVGDFVPFGVLAVGADRPLSASRGKQIVDGLGALYLRPRSCYCWSGLGPGIVYHAGAAASETMAPHPHMVHARRFRGDPDPHTLWVRARSDAVVDTVVRVGPEVAIEVQNAAMDKWYGPTDLDLARLDLQRGITQETRAITLWPAGSDELSVGSSTAGILSASAWGP